MNTGITQQEYEDAELYLQFALSSNYEERVFDEFNMLCMKSFVKAVQAEGRLVKTQPKENEINYGRFYRIDPDSPTPSHLQMIRDFAVEWNDELKERIMQRLFDLKKEELADIFKKQIGSMTGTEFRIYLTEIGLLKEKE